MTEVVTEQVSPIYGGDRDVEHRREAFRSGEIPVAVYGLGKMGLPLAAVFADVSGNVVGADIDAAVVETIRDGGSHIKREPGLENLVSETVAAGHFEVTTEPRDAAERARVHVVIVPTPITDEKEPDLAILDAVIDDIGRGLSPGDLVLVECTVPPGTTETRVTPRLEAVSGLDVGTFGVAFCPERTSSGRALEDIRGAYPKVVGGVDAESTQAAKVIYDEINANGVLTVSDATTAECVKVFEGLYRDVNIALANELAQFTDELDVSVREAIDVANTQPFCDIHDPGPGVGGHCIPYYPYFMIGPFETETPLLQTARAVNDSMPSFTVEKVREGLTVDGKTLDGASVVILGLTYRPGVEEIRASPSIPISRELTERGATVYGVDPLLESVEDFALEQITLDELSDLEIDAVVLVTPHEEFETINWDEIHETSNDVSVVIDGRQTLESGAIASRCYTIGGGYDG